MSDIAESLVERIRTEFPALDWEDCRYVDVGVDHHVIILDKKWVFRTPRNGSDLGPEIGLANYLADKVEAGIPIYKLVSSDQCLAAYPFLEGSELSREVFDGMAAADRNSAAEHLARFLTDLHSISIDGVWAFNVPRAEKPSIDIEEAIDVLAPIFGNSIAPAVSDFVSQFVSVHVPG